MAKEKVSQTGGGLQALTEDVSAIDLYDMLSFTHDRLSLIQQLFFVPSDGQERISSLDEDGYSGVNLMLGDAVDGVRYSMAALRPSQGTK
jgi:hypothetical protein